MKERKKDDVELHSKQTYICELNEGCDLSQNTRNRIYYAINIVSTVPFQLIFFVVISLVQERRHERKVDFQNENCTHEIRNRHISLEKLEH